MKFTPTWHKYDIPDIPSFRELEDITGMAYDENGVYAGPKEKPEMQLVIDQNTSRQYWAPKEYDEDSIKYGMAKLQQDFNSKEWWGMSRSPLTTGQKISVAYIEGLKQLGKTVANAPTKLAGAISGAADAFGLDAGSAVLAGLKSNPAYLASSLARKGMKATAEDFIQSLKDIKTPKGKMGTTASFWRMTANNWQSTLDKWMPDVDENIKARSTMVAIGSMAGQVGGSLLIAAATNGVGGLPAVAAAFGGQQFYDIREEYLQKGYDLDAANIFAGFAALAEGGLEAVGFGNLLKFATYNRSVRNVLLQGAIEATQEALQTTAEEAITNLSGVRQETVSEILAQIAISAMAGFVPGAGFGALNYGAGVAQEKAQYELDQAAEKTKATPALPGSNPKQELALAKQNKGSNQIYEVVKNIANSYGVTDEKAIDTFYYFARNNAVQGQAGEYLLDGLYKQIVAYKNQMAMPDKSADRDNKKAAENIKRILSKEEADRFHNELVKAQEEAGIDKQKAEILAQEQDRFFKNMSEQFGINLQDFKPVKVTALPFSQNVQEQETPAYSGEVPFQSENVDIRSLQRQIDELDKMANRKPKSNLLSTLRKTGVDYSNTRLDPKKLKDLKIKNVPVSKGGLGGEAVDYLVKHGFMAGNEQMDVTTYEDGMQRMEQAEDMLERALSGDQVYRLDDQQMLAQAEEAQGYKEQLQEQLDEKLSEAGKRGYIKIGDTLNEIVLGKYSDVTTLQHELMHHWKNLIEILAAKGNKKAQALKAQMDKIIEENKHLVKQQENAEEEVLSEAYEAWLYSGVVAEDPQEQSLYEAIKQFFQDIYDSVQAITGIRINPEIDMFFRQMTGEMPIQMEQSVESVQNMGTNQETVAFQDDVKDLFKADSKVSKNFAKEVKDSVYDESVDNKQLFDMGKVPAVYHYVGAPIQDLKTNKLAMRKAMGLLTEEELKKHRDWHNHNVPPEVIDNFVKLVSDPIAIFRSNNKGEEHKLVAVLDAKYKDQQITAILSPNPKEGGYTLIPTAFERNDFEKFVNLTKEKNNILYVDEKRASKPGPSSLTGIIGDNALNNSILTKEDVVKGNFILVDGKKRHARNSEGNMIHGTVEGLRAFWKWFGNSKVVDEQGRPLVVYHGSTKEFEIFDLNKTNPENDLGRGFYFTDSEDDVNANYHGGGPDFENRVDRIAERIQNEEGIEWEEAKAKAYEQEYQTDAIYPAYLKMENPFVIGGDNETILTFTEEYNEETDEYSEPEGTLLDFAYNLDNALADLGIDYKISQELFMRASDNGGEISASEVYDIIENDENLIQLLDYGSSFGELLSDVVGQEYDGFIDHTVNQKFGSDRKMGKAMNGMDSDTTHYIVFNSNQIKSVYNKGTFDSKNPNIYYQFGGPKAKTAASDKLEQAVKMDAEGESKRDIRNKTGWFKGADEKWRFEIKDGEINENAVLEKNEIGETEDHGFLYYYTVKLGDLYKAPELYEAYPDLKDITVSFQDLDPEQYGSYHRGNSFFDESISLSSKYLTKDNPDFIKKIDKIKATKEYKKYDEAFTRKVEDGDYAKANKMQDEAMEEFYNTSVGKEYKELMWGKNPPVRREIEGLSKKAKKALIHEIQHAIQQREGFSNGASPKSFMNLKMRAEITQQIMDRKKEVVKQEFIKELEKKAGDKKLVRELIAEEKKANEVDGLYIEGKITREEAVRGEARFKELLAKVGITGAEYYQMRRNLEIKNGLDYWRQDAPYSPYDLYKMVAGEVEARNVEARADMTDEERVKSFPEDTQDIKNADALVVFEDGTELSYKVQEESRYFQDRQQAYRDARAQQTGSKAADEKPSKERISSDIEAIRNNGVEKYEPKSKVGRSLGDWGKHILLSVRQRAGAIDPKIRAFFDKLDYFQPNLEKKFASKANGFIKSYQKLTEAEKNEFDYYIYNQCHEELNKFLKEKGLEKDYQEVRNLLNFIYAVSNKAGIDMGFISEYFPTSMIDYAGFLDHLKGTDKWSYIQKALKEADPEGVWSDKEKAEAINKLLRGYRLDPVRGPKNAKERTILYKSLELMRFYEHSDVALIKYLQGMSQAIAINKAFGKGNGFNTDETIGAIVLDLIESGTITNKEEAEIKRLLKSRLSFGATPEFIAMVKNVGYLQTMNNITSAITQLGDLYAPFYKYSFGTALKSIFGKSEITKQDLGLDKIWEEFSDSSKTGIAVDKLFKAIGLEAMDSFGKNVAINASLINLREQAAKGDLELLARLSYTFGKDAQRVLADIKAGKITDDVKILLWADLADTQPIGRSGVPTGYLDNPHGRIFYQLKTFTLNQISLFYSDCLVNIQKGIKYGNKAQFLKGVKNSFKLLLLLTAGNAAADVLKNLIMGRDIDISDVVVSNLLWNVGVSKYTFYKGKRDGYARAILSSYLQPPQLSIGDDIYMDVRKIATGKRELKDTQMVTYLPFGRAYYWWFGGGRTSEIEKAKKEKKAKRKKK